MKTKYTLFRRGGIYYYQDAATGQQKSLHTRDQTEALQLINARNEAHRQPVLNLHLARAYLTASDPAFVERTWQSVMDQLQSRGKDSSRERYTNVFKSSAFDRLRSKTLLETTADDFLAVFKDGKVSIVCFLKRLHNFAVNLGWIAVPIVAPYLWPKYEPKDRRGITLDEHRSVLAKEKIEEWKLFLELLWETGAAQSDAANFTAEDIDWQTRTISYFRQKTGSLAQFTIRPMSSKPLNRSLHAANFEVIDGQQRTLSICQYVNGDFSIDGLAFHNLKDDQQQQILDYELMVYFCSGTDSEKLDWFRTINIAGEEHTDQELRNAVYAGPWTADAKRYFSKTGCPAYGLASDYMRGSPIRQEYLETAIAWRSDGKIEDYMSKHQHDKNATPLWQYFQKVIGWGKATFPEYRREMKGVDWGVLYNEFKDSEVDTDKLEKQVATLMMDDDVEKKSGIYPYVLDGDERHLNIRAFSDNMKREAYERQKGVCVKCKKKFQLEEMEGDHIKPWHEGGKTNAANCQMLCKDDNRRKSGQ